MRKKKKHSKHTIKIIGKCPSCNAENSIHFSNLHYGNNKQPYATDIPICDQCYEIIIVRKINNRRYKIEGI